MLKAKIPGGANTFHADAANTIYTMAAKAAIDSATVGIDVGGPATNRRIEINGDIDAVHAAVTVGSEMQPAPRVELSIGKGAEVISSNVGIISNSSDLVVRNAGEISGSAGIEVHGGIDLVNTGEISGFFAINIFAGEGTHVIRNAGTITGSVGEANSLAIYGSSQVEKIINTGTIHGDVALAGDNDTFIFKSGKVDGDVAGGEGNDVYVVHKAGLNIVENFGEGSDMVFSSVKFELQAGVDDLQLTGSKDIDAIGNGGNNWLHGNSGRNLVYGWYGDDVLNGGTGNDVLTGGVGADTFIFVRDGGRDIVADYEPGIDELGMYPFKGSKDFADMLAHHIDEKSNGDLWITYGHDTVVLRDTDAVDLQSADFNFDPK